MAIIEIVGYLLMGIIEPGIRFHPEPFPKNYQYDLTISVCKKCHIVRRTLATRHCKYCDVCIDDHIHHCGFIG